MLKLSLFCISLTLIISSCVKDGHETFTVSNHSKQQLFFDWCADYPSPDTIRINVKPNTVEANPGYIIPPLSDKKFGTNQLWGRIEKLFYNKTHKSFMLFDYDLLMTENPETIAENYMVLVRYDVTLDDLDRLDWTLHYPPTPAMRDVHMYPPYEEVIENYNRMISEKE